MSKKFSFKKSQPSTNDVGKSHHKKTLFLDFLSLGLIVMWIVIMIPTSLSPFEQIEETEFYRLENSKYLGSSFLWNGKNESQ